MSHEKDRDHAPSPHPPKEPESLVSRKKPDCGVPEHPSPQPREPVDPKPHPNRALAISRARPA
jgi:hypothetical protein